MLDHVNPKNDWNLTQGFSIFVIPLLNVRTWTHIGSMDGMGALKVPVVQHFVCVCVNAQSSVALMSGIHKYEQDLTCSLCGWHQPSSPLSTKAQLPSWLIPWRGKTFAVDRYPDFSQNPTVWSACALFILSSADGLRHLKLLQTTRFGGKGLADTGCFQSVNYSPWPCRAAIAFTREVWIPPWALGFSSQPAWSGRPGRNLLRQGEWWAPVFSW